jgi:hypothetical protein
LYCLVLADGRLGDGAAAAPFRQRLDAAGFVPPEPYVQEATPATVDERGESESRTTLNH